MFNPADPRSNLLLSALMDADCCGTNRPERVDLTAGQVLYESGVTQRHVYFPTNSVTSLQYILASGASSEFAVVGNKGMVGVSALMGGMSTPSRAVVQSTGNGFRINAQAISDEFARSGPIRHLLLRYMLTILTQLTQNAVCNRHHSIEQQLCRFLLQRLDCMWADELVLTQELIANLLGVRRESVSQAAASLQAAGLIHYERGHITVLDREGLERRSCECYAVVKLEHDRLLPEENVAGRNTMAPGPVALRAHASPRSAQDCH